MASTATYHTPSLNLGLNGCESRLTAQLADKPATSAPSTYQIEDAVYGKVLIDSRCAVEIIHLPEFQRLKDVLQHGISGLVGLLPHPLVNRFDHSIGAMVLVKHVGGSEEAQLAALLHDASHTALSHVADSVFGYVVHEVEKIDYLSKTQIPSVLEKYGFDPHRIFREELFPLLELPSPQLCADRLDYALRDSVSFGYLSVAEAREIFESTISVEGRMSVRTIRAGRLLGEGYLRCDENVWAESGHGYLYKLAARAIKQSLAEGTIGRELLWTAGDAAFWAELERTASAEVGAILARINARCALVPADQPLDPCPDSPDGFREVLATEPHAPTLCRLALRLRTIDPLVLSPEGPRPLSSLDPDYLLRITSYVSSRQGPRTYIVKYTPTTTPHNPPATSLVDV